MKNLRYLMLLAGVLMLAQPVSQTFGMDDFEDFGDVFSSATPPPNVAPSTIGTTTEVPAQWPPSSITYPQPTFTPAPSDTPFFGSSTPVEPSIEELTEGAEEAGKGAVNFAKSTLAAVQEKLALIPVKIGELNRALVNKLNKHNIISGQRCESLNDFISNHSTGIAVAEVTAAIVVLAGLSYVVHALVSGAPADVDNDDDETN